MGLPVNVQPAHFHPCIHPKHRDLVDYLFVALVAQAQVSDMLAPSSLDQACEASLSIHPMA